MHPGAGLGAAVHLAVERPGEAIEYPGGGLGAGVPLVAVPGVHPGVAGPDI